MTRQLSVPESMERSASPRISAADPKVWAVILNWNGLEDTTLCIRSLQMATYPSLSIVVVDNASPDGSGLALQERFPDIPVLLHASNDGYSAGNNIGIRYAMEQGAEFVLVINNDVVVEPDFLLPMVEMISRDSSIGIVTCKAYLQPGTDDIYITAGVMNWLKCTGVKLPPHMNDIECSADFINGSIFLCKREVFETVGLLDERFFMYFEDLEFSRRVAKRYRLAYTPRGVVYHKSGGGTGFHNFSPLYLYHMTRNRFWVFGSEPLFYRIYVGLFNIVLVCVKMTLVLFQRVKGKPWSFVAVRIRALWNGLMDSFRDKERVPGGKRY